MVPEVTDQIIDRIRAVLDPCSCLTDSPVNIVDMGLVESVEIEGTSVEIELVPTSPMCLYMAEIMDEVKAEVSALDAVEEVHVRQNIETIWRPNRLAEHLKTTERAAIGQFQ